jgi:hypothetical protein
MRAPLEAELILKTQNESEIELSFKLRAFYMNSAAPSSTEPCLMSPEFTFLDKP